MIVLNEKEYAEECLEKGIIDKKPYKTLSLLAKYYYHHLNLRKKSIVKRLTTFMDSFYDGYKIDEQRWNDTIEKIANRAKKYPLYQNDGVWITDTELNKIKALNNDILERLSFTLLCVAKLNFLRNEKTNGWVNTDEKDIFESAGIVCTGDQRSDYIGDLKIAGIIEFAKKNTNLNIRVAFIDDRSEKVLYVSDFRSLGNEYMLSRGENYIRCQECGILVKGNKNGTKKYCTQCKRQIIVDKKIIYCEDCGRPVVIKLHDSKSYRCQKCQLDARRKENTMRMRKQRNNT